MISTKGLSICSSSGEILTPMQSVTTSLLTLYILTGGKYNIQFEMCTYIGNMLQYGTLFLECEDDPVALSVFLYIKKYIRQAYRISKDKMYYIGPSIYNDWLQGKYLFPVLFEYEEIIVSAEDFNAVFTKIVSRDFIIRVNDVRLRSVNDLDLSKGSFVICDNLESLNTTIRRKRFIHYNYGSKCIFVYKDVKRKLYRLVWDKRIDIVEHHKLFELFQFIGKLYGQ